MSAETASLAHPSVRYRESFLAALPPWPSIMSKIG